MSGVSADLLAGTEDPAVYAVRDLLDGNDKIARALSSDARTALARECVRAAGVDADDQAEVSECIGGLEREVEEYEERVRDLEYANRDLENALEDAERDRDLARGIAVALQQENAELRGAVADSTRGCHDCSWSVEGPRLLARLDAP